MCRSQTMTEMRLIGILLVIISSISFATNYNITVNGNTEQGDVPHFWSRCCGTGGAQLCVDSDWKRGAKMGVEEAGFMAYRGHRILSHSNPLNWNGSGTPTFNWAKFDEVYDFLVDSLGTIPIVELSAQPKALETNTEWSPPKDLNVYRQMIQAVVEHCNERYGQENVRKWYWEVWNEWDYDGFWHSGTEQQYYDMYKAAVQGATAADPQVRIGGPSSTGSYRLANFLNYCKSNNVQVDLVSNHCYGGGGSGPSADPAQVRDDNRTRSNAIKSFGKPLVSMNTEYSSSYSGQGGNTGANIISMDSHINAPFVAKCVKMILDDYTANTYQLPEVFSYWAISDVFDEGSYIIGHNKVPFGGVFGLINYQGVPKATFNAFRCLHMMGSKRLAFTGIANAVVDGVDGFATVNDDNTEVAVLIYNFYQQLESADAKGTDNVSLTINNLPLATGKVEVKHYRIDSEHSNPYGVWLQKGKPSANGNGWGEVVAASNLAVLDSETIDFTGGAYTKTISLPRQAVSFLMLKKEVVAVDAEQVKPYHPDLFISGSKIFNNGREIKCSIFSMGGKKIKTFSTGSPSLDLRKIPGVKGVCLVRIESEGKLLTSKFMRMD
ncbi:MAG: hypothetical protein JW863_19930 [Chitinispirillaceae bacterium]|nr:hypothetical protein [Chitinispirillaceae bacterium]